MTSRRRRWLIVGTVAALLVAALISLATRVPFSSEALRKRVVATLSDRLDAEVDLGGLTLRIFPRLHAEASDLAIRHKGRRDVPPLIAVKSFTADADIMALWRHRRVNRVKLEGLVISIPPDDDDPDHDPDDKPQRPLRDANIRERQAEAASTIGRDRGSHVASGRQVVIDEVHAPGAKLVILRRNKAKRSKIWDMHELRVRSVSANTKMSFETTLTNAVPPGEIVSEGSFGPWHRDEPGHTALDGRFTFENADLSYFKGISGILSAKGTYGGTLDTIEVQGETDTPEFMVKVSGNKVPLRATYRAIVDGTNGDTRLERIDASFLKTSLIAKGGVYDVEDVKGRDVILDVTMDRARVEDVIRLAVKAPKPPMTGDLKLSTKFVLPAGEADVVDKLRLDGRFRIEDGRFTNPGVQQKINELSGRARGTQIDEKYTAPQKVASDFEGTFILRNAVLALPTLVFDIPGAAVKLSGSYALRSETLAFSGDLYMDAKVSQTVTGWKSLLLKVADPLFSKDGRTVVPIKITGTRDDPAFGVDVKRVFGK